MNYVLFFLLILDVIITGIDVFLQVQNVKIAEDIGNKISND